MSGVQDMFKDMYQNGDEKTKAMIAESWQKAQDDRKPDSLHSKLKKFREENAREKEREEWQKELAEKKKKQQQEQQK